MSARVTYLEHAMAPALGARTAEVPAGLSAMAALRSAGIDLAPDMMLLRRDPAPDPQHLSDLFVPFKDWDKTVLNDSETAVFVRYASLPQGPLGSSAIMAVLAKLSAVAGTSLAGTLGLGSFGASLLSTAFYIGGSMLVSSLLPKPKQNTAQNTASPTYSLSSQSNTARLGQPVPDQIGMCMAMLDVAMQPYSRYVDGKQTVYQLFCQGEGHYAIDQIRASEAVIWRDGAVTDAYPEVKIQIVAPGDQLELFEDNVVTSTEVVSGIDLTGPNEKDHTVSGPYIGSKRGQQATAVEFDVAISCYKLSGSTFEPATVAYKFTGQRIDNDGAPIGDVVTLFETTLTLSSKDPIRRTHRVTLDPAERWQFWAERTNDKSTDLAVSDVVQWTALRVILPSRLYYPNTTMIAISATATSNLNGDALQKVNTIATRLLPVWDPETSTWSALTATRSIAAGACYLLKDVGGKTDSQVDLATLWSLDQTWTDRGDYFDYRFDQRQSLWENSLEPMLRAGRTKPIIMGDRITFVRDEAKALYDGGAFTPANMYPNTFGVNFQHETSETTDAIVAVFIDRRTWTENRVLCALPGSTKTEETAPEVNMLGYTDRDHAWRDGMFLVADAYYRRIRPDFKTNREGTYLLPGAKSRLAHYLMGWGKTAQIEELAEGETVTTTDGPLYQDILTLTQPWSRPAGEEGDNLIVLTTPDGKLYGPVSFDLIDDGSLGYVAAIMLTGMAVVDGAFAGKQPREWGLWDGAGLQKKRPRCILSVGTEVSRDVRVVTMKPDANGRAATVACFVDDARVYSADAGSPPAEDEGSGGAGANLAITDFAMTESVIVAGSQFGLNVVVTGASDAAAFEARWQFKSAVARTGGGYDYVWGGLTDIVGDLARTFDLALTVTDPIPGSSGAPVQLYVRAVNAAGQYGSWFSKTVFLDGTVDTAPGNCTNFHYTPSNFWTTWPRPADYITFSCDAPATATYLHIRFQARRNTSDSWSVFGDRIIDATTFAYYVSEQINDGGPFSDYYIQWKAGNAAGESPDWLPTSFG